MDALKTWTIAEFEAFADHPDQADKVFEFIGGELVEVPSNPYCSELASLINYFIRHFVMEHDLGHVTGEAGGYMVSGERYAPDVAFISYEKQPELVRKGYNPQPPDLAIEVWSPSDSERQLRIKFTNYLAAGTTVWVVYPETQLIEIYTPGQPFRVLGIHDGLDGGTALPGFTLPVAKIFRTAPSAQDE